MVIKGTVHNGQIRFESSTLPEGTQVLITPIQSLHTEMLTKRDLNGLKVEIHRIAFLAERIAFCIASSQSKGLTTLTPANAKSFVFLVAMGSWYCRAVAAMRLSFTGIARPCRFRSAKS